jgi:heterodisulfide reductase subunit A-like polyferredoxin
MEREFVIRPAEKRKTVLVVGGGPASMQAAWTAARRGHTVKLWKRRDALGGNMFVASLAGSKKAVDCLIKSVVKRALIHRTVRLHVMRHAFATTLLELQSQIGDRLPAGRIRYVAENFDQEELAKLSHRRTRGRTGAGELYVG